MLIENEFRCTMTYFIKGKLPYSSNNVIYLITCSDSREHYVGSAIDFRQRVTIHKPYIKSNKDHCGTYGILIVNVLILVINMYI